MPGSRGVNLSGVFVKWRRRGSGHTEHNHPASPSVGCGPVSTWLGAEGEHGVLQLLESVPPLLDVPTAVEAGVLLHGALPVGGGRGEAMLGAGLGHHLAVEGDVV